MPTIHDLLPALQTVLRDAAREAGYESAFVRRPTMTHLSAETFVTSLVFACLSESQPTLDDFGAMSALLGEAVSPQAFDERFSRRAVACLRQVLAATLNQRIQAEPRLVPLLTHFPGVYGVDCTVLDLPDAVAALWADAAQVERTLPVCLDYTTGGLWLYPPTSVRGHDATTPLQRQPLPNGALRGADVGFSDLAVLHDYSQHGVHWLTRLKANAVVYTETGQRWTLDRAQLAQPTARGFAVPVVVGNTQMLPCRLVALRHAADTPAADTASGWHISITHCPAALKSAAAIGTVYAVRWHIELLFKQGKAKNVLHAWRTVRPCRIMCEVYARRIALLLTQWATVLTVWANLATRLPRAAHHVRAWAVPLLLVYAGRLAAAVVLPLLENVLFQCRPIASAQRHLATHQRVLYPTAPPGVSKRTPSTRASLVKNFA